MENANVQKNEDRQLTRRKAKVKSYPYPPYKRRWCGQERWVADALRPGEKDRALRQDTNPDGTIRLQGLPWPDYEVTVEIVDNPEPFDPNANDGIPTQISPRTLAMLKRDRRIAVHVVDGDGSTSSDPAEIVRVAAELSERENEVQKVRREFADAQERAAAEYRRYQHVVASTEKRASDSSRRVAELEAEVARLTADLADRKGAKK